MEQQQVPPNQGRSKASRFLYEICINEFTPYMFFPTPDVTFFVFLHFIQSKSLPILHMATIDYM